MKKIILLFLFCLFFTFKVQASSLATTPIIEIDHWQKVTEPMLNEIALVSGIQSSRLLIKKQYYQLNQDITASLLQNEQILVELPTPNNHYISFVLTPSYVMNTSLAAKYRNIRTFTGYQLGNKHNTGRFDITPQGFHGMFYFNNKVVFIDPIVATDQNLYHVYYRQDLVLSIEQKLTPRLPPRRYSALINRHNNAQVITGTSTELVTYRIAIAATGEYTAFHGGTKEAGLAAIVTMLNRINGIYQQDLSIQLKLAANNDAIIFTDAATDPFDNTDADIDVNTTVINEAIGADNYDVGHVVGTGGGGLAGLGVVCSNYKAEGVTGAASPTNDAFYIDYVAHELGHQFGAEHTFNAISDACDGNRVASSAYEVGSASTIMGYAGICAPQNLQNKSDPYFHSHSIDQISSFIRSGNGNSCGSRTIKTNQAPVVDAGENYTIPSRTPFMLTGQASDAEDDALTYSWEEFDLGDATSSVQDALTDDGKKPLFRSFLPTTKTSRIFPQLNDILSGQSTFGESLPTTSRTLNFRFIVRDGQNVSNQSIVITTVDTGEAFSLIEPSLNTQWNTGEQSILWNIAATDKSPIACNNVDILLSQDGGLSFTQPLVLNTPNDGNETINLPAINTDKGRIKLRCSNNIFFAINDGDIAINVAANEVRPEFIGQQPLNFAEDSRFTLTLDDFTFIDQSAVEQLTILSGDNYQLEQQLIVPNANYYGELTVPLTASNGNLVSDIYYATITILPINDAPIALNDTVSVEQDSTNNIIDVLANDSDIDSNSLTLTAIEYNGSGKVTIVDNKVQYSPASGFIGTETLKYRINDNEQAQADATLTITITAKATIAEPINSSSSGGSLSILVLIMLFFFNTYKVKQGQ